MFRFNIRKTVFVFVVFSLFFFVAGFAASESAYAYDYRIEAYYCVGVEYSFSAEEGKFEWRPYAYPKGGDGRSCGSTPEFGAMNYSAHRAEYRDIYNGEHLCVNFYRTKGSADAAAEDRRNVSGCSVKNDEYLGTVNFNSSSRGPIERTYGNFMGEWFTYFELSDAAGKVWDRESYTTDRITPTIRGNTLHYETRVVFYDMSYFTYDSEGGKVFGPREYTLRYDVDFPSAFQGDSGVVEIPNEESDASIKWDEAPHEFVGWTGSGDAKKIYEKKDCDFADGCWVSFRHYLRRSSGYGSTLYKINGDTGRDGLWKNVTSGSFDGGKVVNVPSNPVHMYPGQKFCETMTFYSDGVSEMASTTICVVATGVAGSDIDLQIEGQNGRRYVYTKPGDEVRLDGIYDPWYQSMYNTALSSGSTINGSVVGGNTTVGGAFNSITNPGWKNAFSIKLGGDCGSPISGVVGSADRLTGRRVHKVSSSNVGTKIEAVAITNCEESVKTTPNWVSLSNNNGKVAATVNTEPKSSAKVEIYTPYNFINTASMTRANSYLNTVPAGSTTILAYDVTVNPKTNKLVTGSDTEKYATIVKNGKVKPKICYDGPNGDDCVKGDESDLEDLNSNSNAEGATVTGVMRVDVPDIPAGKAICIAPLVYPATSGADNNLDEKGDNLWTEPGDEDFRCFTVRKTPNFQVWGGNVAANSISAWSATKKINDGMRLFGSWGELAVASGNNSKMASGAAWGYASNNSGVLQPNPIDGTNTEGDPGGGTNTDNCDSDVLTFGSGCGMFEELGGGSGEMNESTIAAMAEHIKEELNVPNENIHSNVSEIKLGEEDLVSDELYENSGDIYILTNIKINRNNSDNKLSKLGDAPQVVIYAKNINIACNVGRIDAILIAEKTINTCADIEENVLKESSAAQNQLIINGAMYAKDIKFNRTYGAGTGTRSIVPAEIVNYDNSMLFTGGGDGAPTGGSMDVVYVRELAPRYKDD